MSITIPLSAEVEATLTRRASAVGQDLVTYTANLLEAVANPRSLEDLSGEVYRRFLASGVSEEELGEELEQAKHEMRAEKRSQQSK